MSDGGVLRFAAGYDLLVWLITRGRERRFRERIARLAQLQPGERVLDAGCGTGSQALVIRELVGTGAVHGCDASEAMIARARHKARRAGVDVDFRVGRAESLPYEGACFDVVFSTMMLHHLRRAARGAFAAEMHRVLRPGGRALVVDFGPPLRGQTGLVQWLHRDHYLGLPRITELLTTAGFAIRESGEVGTKSLVYALAARQ